MRPECRRELTLRIYSAIVLVAVVLVATWFGGVGIPHACAAAIGLFVYYEWSTMTTLAERSMRGHAFGWFSMVADRRLNLLFGAGRPDHVRCSPVLSRHRRSGLAIIGNWSWWQPGGIFYAGLSAVSLAAIRGEDQLGLVAMLFVFAVVWSTDILAYFVGRAIGGPKLAPRISPGKTWSGAIGGTIAGVAGRRCRRAVILPSRSASGFRSIALFLSVVGQIGDLFESFIKRRFGVKDSSHLIPGHGGVMDRVDGSCICLFRRILSCDRFLRGRHGGCRLSRCFPFRSVRPRKHHG